ncbi:MAG: L-threonylcarbamoyladenylate synthase [bacterium]|nr:L-threonylcarbamoyladenylate synthase [bacterium]
MGKPKTSIKEVIKILNAGGVVIFPTETVYGLICDATNPAALLKIYQIKNRELGKSFPLLVKDFKMLADYAIFGVDQKKIMKSVKKPTNFILKAKNLSPLVMQKHTAAFRISTHSWVKRLFRDFDRPLVATSANLSGKKPISDPRDYLTAFGDRSKLIEAIVSNGINRKTRASAIIDITRKHHKIIRR